MRRHHHPLHALLPGPWPPVAVHVACGQVGDILGCPWRAAAQGCCWASCGDQGSTCARDDVTQNLSSAEVEKAWARAALHETPGAES